MQANKKSFISSLTATRRRKKGTFLTARKSMCPFDEDDESVEIDEEETENKYIYNLFFLAFYSQKFWSNRILVQTTTQSVIVLLTC